MLDAFAAGLIENTNNVYAQSATTQMRSNPVDFNSSTALLNTEKNFEKGTFDIIVYDIDGNEVATRQITIDNATAMGTKNAVSDPSDPSYNPGDPAYDNTLDPSHANYDKTTILGQIRNYQDDNNDGSAINDIDDFINPIFINPTNVDSNNGSLSFSLKSGFEAQGYTFAIVDSDTDATNFAGAMGMHRFFDGTNAKDMELNRSLANDTSKISAAKIPVSGDNQVATMMVNMQFQDMNFYSGDKTYTDSIYGFYDSIVTEVGTTTNAEIIRNDTVTAHFNAVSLEYDSISAVSIDEELTNLIRYQTAYGAASKIITTIDQMMQTLLGLKQ